MAQPKQLTTFNQLFKEVYADAIKEMMEELYGPTKTNKELHAEGFGVKFEEEIYANDEDL